MPGTSGVLTPFAEMDSLYFNDDDEPNHWFYEFNKRMEEIYDKNDIQYIKFDFDSADDFYNALEEMRNVYGDVKIHGTSREGHYEVVVENEANGGEKVEESENE